MVKKRKEYIQPIYLQEPNYYDIGGMLLGPSLNIMNTASRWGSAIAEGVMGLLGEELRKAPAKPKRKVVIAPKVEEIKPRTYTVKAGDNLTKIAKEQGVKMSDIVKYSGLKNPDRISIGQQLNLSPQVQGNKWTDLTEYSREKDYDNVQAIQSVKHDGNYVIVDKKSQKLQVFDSDNNLLYATNQINTGKSGNDYNTITYVDKNGKIQDMKGNNSTPAGITEITGLGTYHGAPSFTRGRYKGNSNELEDIASSLHFGIIAKGKGSNGCVRVGGQQLNELSKYLNVGTKIYTLPEKGGSRFTATQGKLNFTADNPYGKDVKGDKQRFWDDYNVHTDKSYSPLRIDIRDYDGSEYSENKLKFAQTLSGQKEKLQRELGLSSSTYNNIAQLALGIAEQETKFNTSTRKKVKDNMSDTEIALMKALSGRRAGARSYGYTQIKMDGDNKELQGLYKKYGIDKKNIDSADKSALATFLRLYSIYRNEVVGRNFTGADNVPIDNYDALLYKWMGKNEELRNHTATPRDNIYIRNVNRYKNNFDYYSGETYADGGHLFKDGGPKYTPSKGVKERIAKWEGSSMTTPAPDTGRVNRSFEDEARDFYNALPQSVRGYLTQDALDALFSYSYNVGAGNFKKRVAPSLLSLQQALASGKGVNEATQAVVNSMTATKDNTLRGLYNRRAFEREAFRQGIASMTNGGKGRVNWAMDETKVPSYLSLTDWYAQGRRDEWDERMDAINRELNSPTYQITQMPELPQEPINPIGTLTGTPIETLTTDEPTRITQALSDYKNPYAENDRLIWNEINSMPTVQFNSKSVGEILPNYDFKYS